MHLDLLISHEPIVSDTLHSLILPFEFLIFRSANLIYKFLNSKRGSPYYIFWLCKLIKIKYLSNKALFL